MAYNSHHIILVTGSPRSGTTPVGDALAHSKGTVSIYEPMGPTGDVRFDCEFPIPGTTETSDGTFTDFLADLSRLKLRLHPQIRPSHSQEKPWVQAALKISGTRTLHSLRLARVQCWKRNLIWKDPHAVLTIPDVLAANIPVVVTSRPALAQAASYKRLAWQTSLDPIYDRFQARYGKDKLIEDVLRSQKDGLASSVTSAAVVWRMAHSIVLQSLKHPNLHFVRSTDLVRDEKGTYRRLAQSLKLDEPSIIRHVSKRSKATSNQERDPVKTHDWGRSIEHTNTYWKTTLEPHEIETVRMLTGSLSDQLGVS